MSDRPPSSPPGSGPGEGRAPAGAASVHSSPARRLPFPVPAQRRQGLPLRAAVSPTALGAALAGLVIGELAGLPLVAALAVAVAAWLLVTAVSAAGSRRRGEPRRKTAEIDPWAVPEPWKTFVAQALDARDRFRAAVASAAEGPLKDRLEGRLPLVESATAEVFAVAKQAASLRRSASLADPEALSEHLRRLQQQPKVGASQASGQPGSQPADQESTLAAQLRAARDLEAAAAAASQRLAGLVSRLSQVATEAASLSADRPDTALDELASEIEALHRALREVSP